VEELYDVKSSRFLPRANREDWGVYLVCVGGSNPVRAGARRGERPSTLPYGPLDNHMDGPALRAVRCAVVSPHPPGFLLITRIDPDDRMLPESNGGGSVSEGVCEDIGARGKDRSHWPSNSARANARCSLIRGSGETEGLEEVDCNSNPANRQHRPCHCRALSGDVCC